MLVAFAGQILHLLLRFDGDQNVGKWRAGVVKSVVNV